MNNKQTILLVGSSLFAIAMASFLYGVGKYKTPVAPPTMIYSVSGAVELVDDLVQAHDIITSPDLGALYYLNENLQRVVYPDEQTYLSWYQDFSGVKYISRQALESYPLSGRNATIRSGTFLVTIQSSPQVWVVGSEATLHWLAGGENQAAGIFGNDWQRRLVDIPEYFFADYKGGADISAKQWMVSGMLLRVKGETVVYLVTDHQLRVVTPAGFTANYFQERFVIEVDELPELFGGEPIIGAEDLI